MILLVRGDSLADKMSSYLVERIESMAAIEVRLQTEVDECLGAERLGSRGGNVWDFWLRMEAARHF